MQEPVAILSGQLKLGRQREHGLIEVPQHSFHRDSILVAVVDVIIQTDELPENKEVKTVYQLTGKSRQKKKSSKRGK